MLDWLIDRPSYVPPVQIGEIMRGSGGRGRGVKQSRKFAVSAVQGMFGWQEYVVSGGESVPQAASPLPLSANLSPYWPGRA